MDIKNVYRNASIVANNRVVFNIKGNKYRLVVAWLFSMSTGLSTFALWVRTRPMIKLT